MASSSGIAALPPAARARVILAAARAPLDRALWQATLGDGDDGGHVPFPPGSDIGRLVASLTPSAAPVGSQPPQPPAPQPPPPPVPVSGTVPDHDLRRHPNQDYAPAIAAAAARTGIAASTLVTIIDAEAARRRGGTWDPLSRNPRSSAAGLGQFLNRTWLDLARQPGTALNRVAAMHGWLDGAGHPRPGARGAILALRYDPDIAIQSIADYSAANLEHLRQAGIVPTDPGEGTARLAYIAHYLGAADAIRHLRTGLDEVHAARLLATQVGAARARVLIGAAGSARAAHAAWLDRRIARTLGVHVTRLALR